jgi:hypothetical protein
MGDSANATDSQIGVLMVELPPDWWLPEGYSLEPKGPQVLLPLSVTDPLGQDRQIYTNAGFRPSQERIDSIAEAIEDELGPLQAGFSPETKHQLGMDRPDLLGFINSTIMMPVEAVVALFDLATYGISATIIAGTQGMAQAGWMSQSDARRLRRDLNLLAIVVAAETGRGPARPPTRVQTSALRVAAMARAKAAAAVPALLVRIVRTAPEQLGRAFAIIDDIVATAAVPTPGTGGLPAWLARLRAGRAFDAERAGFYAFNQIYVVKAKGRGYWILDSYGPLPSTGLAGGPASRKFTQLASIELESALRCLNEAHAKYKPGTRFADVPSTPGVLRGQTIAGQLFLEVPRQDLPVPAEILAAARRLNIQIRDVTGRIY